MGDTHHDASRRHTTQDADQRPTREEARERILATPGIRDEFLELTSSQQDLVAEIARYVIAGDTTGVEQVIAELDDQDPR